MAHQVNVSDIIEARSNAKVLLAASTKEKKRLFATCNGGFQVEVNNEIIFETIQPFAAVEKYNSIVLTS